MKTVRYNEWKTRYYKYYNVGGYRLGQHFINCFIKDEHSTVLTKGLWEMTNKVEVESSITAIVDEYQWDWDALQITLKQPFEYDEEVL